MARFLILDAYAKSGRAELQTYGAPEAGTLYRDMLLALRPQADYEIAFPADANSRITDLSGFDAMLWTGSSMTIFEDTPEVARQIELTREGFRRAIPAFGSCWALQLAATAAGGLCQLNPKGREFGLTHNLTLTDKGRSHPVFAGRSGPFSAFTAHTDEVVTLPADTHVLLSNQSTDIQAAHIHYENGDFFALQYHPEFTFGMIATLAKGRKERLLKEGFYDSAEQFAGIIGDYQSLQNDPNSHDAKQRLKANDDVIDPQLRWSELKHWLEVKGL